MRLIDTEKFQLCEFFEKSIPPFAILSHTWEDNEVIFHKTLQSEMNKKLSEHPKIGRGCHLARSEGLKYIWIDTCCIDKSSSAELTESINSMYKWYQNAQICYVYMSDISLSVPTDSPDFKTFGSSKWFTRGWTLQELLAPEHVLFYDMDWWEIGSKFTLSDAISRACHISEDHLLDPMSASVAAKMSWVSRRQTTRTEDIAYCLLGLFNVNMPLIYGEGEKAFNRLQQEIIYSSSDESLFAWADENVLDGGLLAPAPSCFTNCGDIIVIDYIERSPYTVTSQGLQMMLLAREEDIIYKGHSTRDQWTVPLNCARESEIESPIVIHLASSWERDGTLRIASGRTEILDVASEPKLRPLTFYLPLRSQIISKGTDKSLTQHTNIKILLSDEAREVLCDIRQLSEQKTPIADLKPNSEGVINLARPQPRNKKDPGIDLTVLFMSETGIRFILSQPKFTPNDFIYLITPATPRLREIRGSSHKEIYEPSNQIKLAYGSRWHPHTHTVALVENEYMLINLRKLRSGEKTLLGIYIDVTDFDRSKLIRDLLV